MNIYAAIERYWTQINRLERLYRGQQMPYDVLGAITMLLGMIRHEYAAIEEGYAD